MIALDKKESRSISFSAVIADLGEAEFAVTVIKEVFPVCNNFTEIVVFFQNI